MNKSNNSLETKDFLKEYKENETRHQYLLDLQRKYKNKEILECEMSEQDRNDLEDLYIEQNNELKRKIRLYDSKFAKKT